jgi:soluble lytic murein transglycosylase
MHRSLVLPAVFALLMSLGMSASAFASSLPRLKPDRPHVSQTLTDADFRRLIDAFEALERNDFNRALVLEKAINDGDAAKLVRWRRFTEGEPSGYTEARSAFDEFRDWPRAGLLQGRVEELMSLTNVAAADRLAFFDQHPPISGDGLIARGEAHLALGDTIRGKADIREAWHFYALNKDAQARVLKRHAFLTREDHEARTDLLIWRGYTSRARELFPKIGVRFRSLAEARLVLAARGRGVSRAIDNVHPSLADHPGLLYERARWRRRAGNPKDALPLLLQMPAELPSEAAAREIWEERRLHIGNAIKARRWKEAYTLAYRNNLRRGADFADAEFVAGWLALRKLDEPAIAIEHFKHLRDNVTTPISTARGNYWVGRAYEAMSKSEEARAAYALAGQFHSTFYGQLALARLGGAARAIAIAPEVAIAPEDEARFAAEPMTKALLLLRDLDEPNLFDAFITHLDDRATTSVDIALLSRLAEDYGRKRMMVRVAKTGLANGLLFPLSAYPVVDLPTAPGAVPEPAMVLALIRQESEFATEATSSANARGLMQMLPSTAREEARLHGLPYSTGWLTGDPDYNMTLGQLHLQRLINRFDGSYVMAAAAYNAGAHRVTQWIGDYGDPRTGEVDMIDWMESIPFSETRNYVQRVLESVLMYRAQLNGGSAIVTLDSDIHRGVRNAS